MVTKRVVWTDSDWDKVCSELLHQHPELNKPDMIARIKADDVVNAMHNALPPKDWRASMNMTHVRPKLKERFAALQKPQEKQEILTTLSDTRIQSHTLEPLLEAAARQIFEYLKPMLDDYISSSLGVQRNIKVAPAPEAAVAGHHREKLPKRLRVGIIGLLPIQANDLIQTFPNISFTILDDASRIKEIKSKMSNMDCIFGLTSKMSRNAEDMIKSMRMLSKYRRADGRGTTGIKRSIQIWLDSMK